MNPGLPYPQTTTRPWAGIDTLLPKTQPSSPTITNRRIILPVGLLQSKIGSGFSERLWSTELRGKAQNYHQALSRLRFSLHLSRLISLSLIHQLSISLSLFSLSLINILFSIDVSPLLKGISKAEIKSFETFSRSGSAERQME